ncbi:MAG: DUF1592 domain-containing protein [Myxococcota bacterium]
MLRPIVVPVLLLLAVACENGRVGERLIDPPTPGGPRPTGSPSPSPSPTGDPSPSPTPTPSPPPYEVAPIACDASAPTPDLPLRRLTRDELQSTLRELVRRSGIAPSDAEQILSAKAELLGTLPEDQWIKSPIDTHGGFRRLDQAVQQTHIDALYTIAVALGRDLVDTADRRAALLGSCATNASTADDLACLQAFVGRFGALVERRPLASADVDRIIGPAAAHPLDVDELADVLGVMLSSPRLFYLVEDTSSGAPDTTGPLDSYSLAARLSYLFWGSMPDEALFTAAASGELETTAGLQAQVRRLFEDPRANPQIETFFYEWLRLEDLGALNTLVGTPVYDAFAGSDSPSSTLHQEMTDELRSLVRWVVRHQGTVRDLMTNRMVFTTSPALAKIYGEAPWDGASTPALFRDSARVGLITRAALVAAESAASRPVVKGARIRNALLCQALPPPPPSVMARPIEITPDQTTRETVEAITETEGTICRGCHHSLINPAGFTTENFDALGRLRSVQRLFGADGAVVATRPIHTEVSPNIAGRTATIAGAAELTELLVQGDFQTCFARKYTQWVFQRTEDLSRDGCAAQALQAQALQDRPLAELMISVALTPRFTRRNLP